MNDKLQQAWQIARYADVSTPDNSVVLYSISYQPSDINKRKAMAYLQENPNKKMLDDTECGKKAIRQINEIKHLLDEGRNVCIYCFCKNVNKCHRGILGHLFSKKGYTVKVL